MEEVSSSDSIGLRLPNQTLFFTVIFLPGWELPRERVRIFFTPTLTLISVPISIHFLASARPGWVPIRVLLGVAVQVRPGVCVRVHPGACLRVRRGYSPGPHRVHLRVFSGVVASGVSGYVRGCASGCIAGVSQGAPSGIRRVRCRVLVGYVFGCSPGSSSGRLAGTSWVVSECKFGVWPESVAGGLGGSESSRRRAEALRT